MSAILRNNFRNRSRQSVGTTGKNNIIRSGFCGLPDLLRSLIRWQFRSGNEFGKFAVLIKLDCSLVVAKFSVYGNGVIFLNYFDSFSGCYGCSVYQFVALNRFVSHVTDNDIKRDIAVSGSVNCDDTCHNTGKSIWSFSKFISLVKLICSFNNFFRSRGWHERCRCCRRFNRAFSQCDYDFLNPRMTATSIICENNFGTFACPSFATVGSDICAQRTGIAITRECKLYLLDVLFCFNCKRILGIHSYSRTGIVILWRVVAVAALSKCQNNAIACHIGNCSSIRVSHLGEIKRDRCVFRSRPNYACYGNHSEKHADSED